MKRPKARATDPTTPTVEPDAERRAFLEKAGRYAAVTPPAITLMLSVAATPAHADPYPFRGVGYGVGGNPTTKTPGKFPGKS